MTYKMIMCETELDDALRVLDEPSRELDDRIWRWVNDRGLCRGWQYDIKDAPAYTRSVDAALTLIPVVGEPGALDERADYIIEHVNGGLTIGARIATENPDHIAFGCNAAAALSRAAIQFHIRERSVNTNP